MHTCQCSNGTYHEGCTPHVLRSMLKAWCLFFHFLLVSRSSEVGTYLLHMTFAILVCAHMHPFICCCMYGHGLITCILVGKFLDHCCKQLQLLHRYADVVKQCTAPTANTAQEWPTAAGQAGHFRVVMVLPVCSAG